MTLLDTIRTALTSLTSNKLRAGLALLGIVIGVGAVIALMSIGKGLQQTVTERIESLGTNLLFVTAVQTADSSANLTLEDADALLDPLFAPSVAAVAPELRLNGTIVNGRENTFSQIAGVTPEYLSVRNLEVASGQFLSNQHVESRAEVAVLGSSVAEELFGLRDPVGADRQDQRPPVHRRRRPRKRRRVRLCQFRRPGAGASDDGLLPAQLAADGPGRRQRSDHQRPGR